MSIETTKYVHCSTICIWLETAGYGKPCAWDTGLTIKDETSETTSDFILSVSLPNHYINK